MRATCRALREYGYADLTMQAIADEADRSKSLLHYHYDTKEGLLVAFLRYHLQRFADRVPGADAADPAERLELLVDMFLPVDDAEYEQFHRALLELRTQAPYRAAFREQLGENRAYVRRLLAETIAEGVTEGVFRDVDAEATARFVLAALDGARSAHVTLGERDDPEVIREQLREYVLSDLRRGERA
ncbi:MAG: TetR/AcrR family transcriptional regulator [Haloferacaceae archaeon]